MMERAALSKVELAPALPLEPERTTPCIFSEAVPVRVKPAAKDEFTASLVVRLRPDNLAHPKTLVLELTDESDLFFLHTLVLGEGDFHALKAEQRLLVDFQSFPSKLVELLGRCMEASDVSTSAKMLAMLECWPGGESTLSIVESNHFRELTHLALRLRQGSDEAVKQHLASKLRGIRTVNSELSERLRVSEESVVQTQKQVEELSARARVVAEERSHLERSLTQTHQRELMEIKEEKNRTIAELQRKALEDRSRAEADLQLELTQVQERLTLAESCNEDLQQQLQVQTSSAKSSRERLATVELQLSKSSAETTTLRDQVKQLEQEKFEQQRELTELRIGRSALQDQLISKEQLAANQAALHEQAANQRKSLEEALATSKQQLRTLEDKFSQAAGEIAKGNHIIQTLRTNLKQTKAKVKLKSSALSQQEKTMLELERAEDASKHVVEEKAHELARAQEREEQLRRDAEELRKKLAKAHEVLESNQEVIEYLNRQLTERDLRGLPGTGGSLFGGTGGSIPGVRGPSLALTSSSIPLSSTSLDAIRKFEAMPSLTATAAASRAALG